MSSPQNQPLNTLTPEALRDRKEFKKQLMEHIRAGGGASAFDSKQIFQGLVKDTLEAFLELEMEEHLGYAKREPEGRNSGNSRNGGSSKTVRGDFGEVEIETPRDRNASFEPKVVAKRQTSVGNFSEAVISLYTRGLSTREIEQHVKEIYGIDISPQFVSRVTEELQQQIVEWHNRPLDRVYPVIFVDGLRVSVRTEKGVLKKCIYTVLGVGIGGRQEVLGLWIEETEGARFWLKVFNDLKARGVADALIVCGDGLTGLRHRRSQVLAPDPDRTTQPRRAGHSHRLRRWAERISGGDCHGLPEGPGAVVHRAPDAEPPEFCELEGAQNVGPRSEADLSCRHGRGSSRQAGRIRGALGRPVFLHRPALAPSLGRRGRALLFSRRDSKGDLHHQCRRIAEHDAPQSD